MDLKKVDMKKHQPITNLSLAWLSYIIILIYSTTLTAENNAGVYLMEVGDIEPITVTGTVTDVNGEELIGVNVLVKGTDIGTATDLDGSFEFTDLEEDAVLVFSYIGYKTLEVPVAGQTSLKVVLEEDLQTLDEVVVVGYGEQSRETLTSSVTKLDDKVIENTVFGDATSALQGTVSGVRVQTTSGQPGASPRVIVRGGTSINNPNGAQPLYVVNGVIRQNLDGINTADIESMQVLKDAAATAIYGARASNGVVIVSLKEGVAGKTLINYKYSLGFSQLREKYDVLSARDYVYYGRLGVAAIGEKHPNFLSVLDNSCGYCTENDLTNQTGFTTQYLTEENKHKLEEGWESIPDPLDPSKTIIFANTDWQDVLFRTGKTNDHYLNISGGSAKTSFNMGLGYTDIAGIAIKTNYQRLSANLNGKMQFNDKVFAFGGLNYSRISDNEVFSVNAIFERSIGTPPTAKYKFEDGTLAPGQSRSAGNPEYHLNRSDNKNLKNSVTLVGGLNWEIIPNLIFEPSASLFYTVGENNGFQKSYNNTASQFIDSRDASAAYSRWDQRQFDATLTYADFLPHGHNVQAKVGLSYFGRLTRSINASGRGAATDLIPTLNASAEPVSVSSYSSEQVIFGYFGRITYDFERKYLMTINARYDGASNLGSNNKWGFFPGVSLGWNLHNESFWANNSIVSSLKLRASYGLNGNLGNLTDFQAQGEYSVGATYDGVAAVENTSLANQNLKWEQSRTLDFGFDAGMFDNRVHLIFDFYQRFTENLITSLALPNSTGFGSILTNLGSLENKGFEIEAGINVINKGKFIWDLSVNSSFNQNKILKLPDNENKNNRIGGYYVYNTDIGDYAWEGGLQEGGRIGDMYGYKYLYVYATDEDAAAGPTDEVVATSDKRKFGGDVAWLDKDGNNIIDPRDRVYMGNIFPKWTGGLSSTLSYDNLSLYIRMDYTTGHTIYNYTRAYMNGQFQGDVNATSDVLRSWQMQGDITDIPRYYWADQSGQTNYWRGDPRNLNNGSGSSQQYESGDYLALREITLMYNLPSVLYSKLGFTNLRLNITANNIKYFTNYSGFSPEDGGMDQGRYPVPRNIAFGINLSF